jgi:ABC-type Fe3+-hydroxamate transport system substrate-binding protein
MRFTDQLQRTIQLEAIPKRIVSLVPSQTELLFDLGLHNEVVGITKFCIHPTEWFKTKTRVGGTKNVNIAKAAQLQPDLIIANKEENVKEDIEALEKIAPVWISDIKTLDDALMMIKSVGEITNTSDKATQIIDAIKNGFNALQTYKVSKNLIGFSTLKSCCYLIWQNPYMTVGEDTFINNMLGYCGMRNVFASQKRYPVIDIEALQKAKPEIVLLSSEPFPFKQKHIDELQLILPTSKILLVDGEMFSWYGSRLLESSRYFKRLFY